MIVLDKIALTAPKTREVAKILKNLGVEKTALLVLAGPDDTITRASANIAGLKTVYVNTINVLDILGNEKFIITESKLYTPADNPPITHPARTTCLRAVPSAEGTGPGGSSAYRKSFWQPSSLPAQGSPGKCHAPSTGGSACRNNNS